LNNIKELMRRSAQFALLEGKDAILTLKSVDAALEEMVFIGGSLNLRLLGAADGLEANRTGDDGFRISGFKAQGSRLLVWRQH
jgi:hypothetical protein